MSGYQSMIVVSYAVAESYGWPAADLAAVGEDCDTVDWVSERLLEVALAACVAWSVEHPGVLTCDPT